MIYVFTQREFWSFTQTATKFYLTSAILGIAATWLSILLLDTVFNNPAAQQLSRDVGDTLLQALIFTSGCKFVFELSMLSHLAARRVSPLKRSAQLLVGPLSNKSFARFALGVLGGVVMPVFLMSQQRDHWGCHDYYCRHAVRRLFGGGIVGTLPVFRRGLRTTYAGRVAIVSTTADPTPADRMQGTFASTHRPAHAGIAVEAGRVRSW